MGNINKNIEGVVLPLIGDDTKINSFKKFLNSKSFSHPDLDNLERAYEDMVNDNMDSFLKMSNMEEKILQLRMRETLRNSTKIIKFSNVRGYIYARVPFYRKNKKNKDIRYVVGKVDEFDGSGDDPQILSGNKRLMERVKNELINKMNREIYDGTNQS